MRKAAKKITIGRYEKVSFPQFDLKDIDAKIDTGAASTSIHAHKIWTEKDMDGNEILKFQLFDPKHPRYDGTIHSCNSFHQKTIRSSNGKKEKRYVLKTITVLGNKRRKTDINLTNRKKMKFPVLVGRRLLRNGFLIDVSKKYLTSEL